MNEIDKQYIDWLKELKLKVKQAQQRAFLSVNQEMLRLYWNLGKEITQKADKSNWGDKVVTRIAKDLQSEFPEINIE